VGELAPDGEEGGEGAAEEEEELDADVTLEVPIVREAVDDVEVGSLRDGPGPEGAAAGAAITCAEVSVAELEVGEGLEAVAQKIGVPEREKDGGALVALEEETGE